MHVNVESSYLSPGWQFASLSARALEAADKLSNVARAVHVPA